MKNVFGATDKGLVREANQDTFVAEKVSDKLSFAILCDGMGGEAGGNIASGMAAGHAAAALKRGLAAELTEPTLKNIMFSAISGANALVYDAAQKDEGLSGMGTTMIVAAVMENTLYIACVGDSRAYCVSKDKEIQLTHDHTVVQMLVDLGEITAEDAKTHPKRHFITKAVGVSPQVEPDFIARELDAEDMVLLCSDGLYTYLEEDMLYGLLKTAISNLSTQPLIDFAKSCGGADNITAVVFAN